MISRVKVKCVGQTAKALQPSTIIHRSHVHQLVKQCGVRTHLHAGERREDDSLFCFLSCSRSTDHILYITDTELQGLSVSTMNTSSRIIVDLKHHPHGNDSAFINVACTEGAICI